MAFVPLSISINDWLLPITALVLKSLFRAPHLNSVQALLWLQLLDLQQCGFDFHTETYFNDSDFGERLRRHYKRCYLVPGRTALDISHE